MRVFVYACVCLRTVECAVFLNCLSLFPIFTIRFIINCYVGSVCRKSFPGLCFHGPFNATCAVADTRWQDYPVKCDQLPVLKKISTCFTKIPLSRGRGLTKPNFRQWMCHFGSNL